MTSFCSYLLVSNKLRCGFERLVGCEEINELFATAMPAGSLPPFCRANATAQKIALMGKLANPQKFINFVRWSSGCGMNEITARLLTAHKNDFALI